MISVVMPAYNSEKFIAPAIESILNQTYRDFEFIIVDDGSTDKTLEIIESYAEKDDRVKVVHGKHEGVSAALNQGIAETTNPWVVIMHSDDIALPERLEKQLAAAQADPDVVIWGTDGYHMNSKDDVVSQFRVGPTTKEESIQQRKQGKMVQSIHPTVMLNKEVYLKAGKYDSRFDGCEDVELFDRMQKYGPLVTIPERLLYYRVHGNSLVMQKYMSQTGRVRYVKARQMHRFETGEELDYDEFLQQDRQRPAFVRFREYIKNLSGLYYRQAGIAYSEKHYPQTVFYFGLAGLLRPIYVGQRIWKQLLSPEARRNVESQHSPSAG